MRNTVAVLRTVAGVIFGYWLLAMLITLVFERGLGGVSYSKSSLGVLVLAGFCGFASAVIGGAAAVWISGIRAWVPALIMSVLVVAETSWLVSSGRAEGPLWFDVLGGLSLIVGIQLGAAVAGRLRGRSALAPAH
jgi:hypothetical protein